MSNIKQKFLSLAAVILVAVALLSGALLSATGLADIAAADAEPISDTTVIDLADINNMHWALVNTDSDSSIANGTNLLGGRVYVYRYKASSDASEYSYYYSVSKKTEAPESGWVEWTQAEASTANLQTSIVSYKEGESHRIEIQSKYLSKYSGENKGFTIPENGYTDNEATAQGKYVATAQLVADDDYIFVNNGHRADLDERGIIIDISADGKSATMTKVWYVAKFDNALLDGDATKSAGVQIEYTFPSWQFGEYTQIKFPVLFHGDGALDDDIQQPEDYDVIVNGESIIENIEKWNPLSEEQENDIVKFSLMYTDESGNEQMVTIHPMIRSEWSYYINECMPAGEYVIKFNIAAIELKSHVHWWDGTEHNYVGTSEFSEFECSYNFTVFPGDLTLDGEALNGEDNLKDNDDYRFVDIDDLNAVTNNYSNFFKFSSQLLFDANSYISKDIIAEISNEIRADGTYWTHGENLDKYFESAPHLEFNVSNMNSNEYLRANDYKWSEYILNPNTYKVFYMAKMKNYSSHPLISDRYDHFYEVIVYKDVTPPGLNRVEMFYTGRELSVAPQDGNLSIVSDTSLYDWTGNTGVDVGEYTVTFTLNDPIHYKWAGLNDDYQPYEFGDEYQIKWQIKPASVPVPQIAERHYTPSGKPFAPAITIPTDINGRPVFSVPDVSFDEAGDYYIELTLSSSNYEWNITENDFADDKTVYDNHYPLKVSVKFTVSPEQNMWTVSPRIINWQWGGYNNTVNIFEGTSMRGNVKFSISYDKNGNSIVEGLSDIIPDGDDYGVVNDTVAAKLGALNKGDYYLIAKVDGAQNYTGLEPIAYKFSVEYATNYWDVAPNIVSWKYGGFDANINLITGVPHFIANSGAVKFSIVSGESEDDIGDLNKDFVVYGLDNIAVVDGVVQGEAGEILATLGRDRKYWLRAVVEREAVMVNGQRVYNYSELNTYLPLNILQAENYWVETPNITRWVVGEESNVPVGVSKWGEPSFVIYRYVTNADGDKEKGEKLFDSKEGINRLSEAKAGWHLLEAMVEGDVNYTSIESRLEFKVFSVDTNFWRTVPNIQSWIAGSAPNAPVAQAAFGDVVFAYYDRADYLANGADAQKLSGVPVTVGKYVLVATAVSDELDDLVATVEFSIYTATADVSVYYAIIGVLAGIIVLGLELVIMFAVLRNRKKLKLVASEGCGRIELDAADDEDLAEEFDEEFEDEDEQPDIITDDDIDAEIIAEPVDADAPALEPSEID